MKFHLFLKFEKFDYYIEINCKKLNVKKHNLCSLCIVFVNDFYSMYKKNKK